MKIDDYTIKVEKDRQPETTCFKFMIVNNKTGKSFRCIMQVMYHMCGGSNLYTTWNIDNEELEKLKEKGFVEKIKSYARNNFTEIAKAEINVSSVC